MPDEDAERISLHLAVDINDLYRFVIYKPLAGVLRTFELGVVYRWDAVLARPAGEAVADDHRAPAEVRLRPSNGELSALQLLIPAFNYNQVGWRLYLHDRIRRRR
jgi:hypothetical protein